MPRFYVDLPLCPNADFSLPAGAARHVQVLRMQPGQQITLFNGLGGQWTACITHMGRQQVQVQVLHHDSVEREASRAVHLAVGLMAAERMDWLAEKATELGAASLQPIVTSRSNLRLSGERASKKQQHWKAVATAACEQSGRNRVPAVHPVQPWGDWLAQPAPAGALRWVLSLADGAQPLQQCLRQAPAGAPVCLLSGPEGGLGPEEDQAARAAGWLPVSLGARTLRAETAPLAALACLALDDCYAF